MKAAYRYKIGDETLAVIVERTDDHFQVSIGANSYEITAKQLGHGFLNLTLEGQQLQAHVARDERRRYVAMAGDTWVIERQSGTQPADRRTRSGPGVALDSLEATMPGVVLEVLVVKGDLVERGETLVLLEAMKMELQISAPCAGIVRLVRCTEGQVVERGQTLVEIEAT